MARRSLVSLDKALDILCSFDHNRRQFSAQEISDRHKIPLSSTYRYLEILLRRGFLAKDKASHKFSLGLALFRLGTAATAGMNLREISRPHMKTLSDLSGETVLLTMLSGFEAVCIESIETSKRIKLSLAPGTSLPLHAGASSKVLLAFQEDKVVNAMIAKNGLAKLTDSTITDPQHLERDLQEIRKRGYVVSIGEADPGAKAVAAPIFDHQGKLAGGLSIAGPAERMTADRTPELIAMVTSAAARISQELGYGYGKTPIQG